MKRVDHLQAMVRQRKTTGEVQCNLKMVNEQQRAMLRKSGKQLFVDETDQLTTNEARHTDLAETGNVGQSELLSTSELLGGRTQRISRDTGCDLLTREESSRAAGLLTDNLPDSLLVPSFLCAVVSVAMERTKVGSSRTEISDAIAGHWKVRSCGSDLEAVITQSSLGRKKHTQISTVWNSVVARLQQILLMERWNLVQHVLQQATLTQALTAETEHSSERDEPILSALPASERRKLELSIRKLHPNCGFPPSRACANDAMERCQG